MATPTLKCVESHFGVGEDDYKLSFYPEAHYFLVVLEFQHCEVKYSIKSDDSNARPRSRARLDLTGATLGELR